MVSDQPTKGIFESEDELDHHAQIPTPPDPEWRIAADPRTPARARNT